MAAPSALGRLDVGLTLQVGKAMFLNSIVKALTTSSNAPRDLEIARALIAQGFSRDAILSSLARIEAQRDGGGVRLFLPA